MEEPEMAPVIDQETTEMVSGHGHILIGGTGRTGTTLLVQILAHLTFDTGYSKDEALRQVDSLSRAGLERSLSDENLPHVIKSPWLADEIAEALERGTRIEAAIIPVRNLFDAAESRRHVNRQAESLGKDPLTHPGTIWKTVVPSEQEKILAEQFYKFLEPLVANNIPLIFLSFPRFTKDPEYFYERLRPLFERHGIPRDKVLEVHAELVDPALITEFSEPGKIPFDQEVSIRHPSSASSDGGDGGASTPGAMETYLSPVSFWVPNFFEASEWIEHVPFAFWLIEAHQPRTLVELGTHGGCSYFSFCQAVKTIGLATRCYAVDHWMGDKHAGFYGEEFFERVRDYNQQYYAAFSRLVRSDFDEAVAHFSDASIDLLHIDGRHFYEDVKHDFETWLPKLSDRAIVLFHDTNVRERNFGVFQFWEELQADFPNFEFLHGHGLGVLGYGSALPQKIRTFLGATADAGLAADVRKHYGRLGSSLKADIIQRQKYAQVTAKLKEQERLAEELKQQAGEAKELNEYAEDLRTLSAKVASLQAQLPTASNEQEPRARELNWHMGELATLRHHVASLETKLSNVYASRSWRMTAPLRAVAQGFKWILGNRRSSE